MVSFYSEILRGVGFRDNNFKPLASNDPATSTIGWTVNSGGIFCDGDLLTLSGGIFGADIQKTVSLSTNTYPYLVVRVQKSLPDLTIIVNYTSGSSTFTTGFVINATKTFTLTSGKTVSNIHLQVGAGLSATVDYVAVCSNTPIQLSQNDLKSGTVTRTSLGNDHAELELANWRGKYTAKIFGSGGANAINFGDHLHIYLGQGANLFHVYGGYVELENPVHPPDTMMLHSRGFGLALLRSKVLQIYNNSTPQTIINDVTDSFVNAVNKNILGIASNYQLTRSFVQAIGSSLPLFVSSLNYAYNVMHELADLTVFQGSPAIFFVDPAENIHWVPLGLQGAANWTTDPFPAAYAGSLVYGTNIATSTLSRDTQSLVNRVHYYGIAQTPGQVDGITEYGTNGALQADWDVERLNTGVTTSLTTVTSPVAIGGHSNQNRFTVGSDNFNALGAVFYPKTHSSTLLDFTKIGSQWSPPVVEFYFRVHPNGNATYGMRFSTLFFANDSTNRYEYRLTNGTIGVDNSILHIDTPSNDVWYHILVPVGPNAGNLFLAAPTPNFVAQPTLLTPIYQNIVGSPDWSTIKYIGLYNGGTDAMHTASSDSLDVLIDGFRILGGRYRLAYDNRTLANGRYPDMSEAYYADPISKDETAIKGFAGAELLKLRNGILRGSIVTPLLADIYPEQQVRVTDTSANLSAQYLRCTSVIHHFSPNGFLTELALTDDFTNSRPLDQWKLMNVLLEMGENAIFSRQLYDLKSAVLDPTFTPITDAYT